GRVPALIRGDVPSRQPVRQMRADLLAAVRIGKVVARAPALRAGDADRLLDEARGQRRVEVDEAAGLGVSRAVELEFRRRGLRSIRGPLPELPDIVEEDRERVVLDPLW